MKALTFHAPGEIHYEDVPEPVLRDPRDAILRVGLTAICGSDLHVYRGHERGLDHGTIMGHEFLGVVVEAGRDVESFRPGARVAAPFTTSCGRCFYCRSGLTCRCERGSLFGWVTDGHGLHGGQAELVRVPLADSTLVALPDQGIDEELLLAGDVLATGFYAAELGGVTDGQVVAVLGCGPVGLAAIVAARSRRAACIFAVDGVPERRAVATELGAEALDLEADPLGALRAATGGRGADVILEAVGGESATLLAYEAVRPGGTIAAVGVHNEPRFAITPGQLYDKNLTYRAGRCPARRLMPELLERVKAREFELSRIVSHRLPLRDGPRAYQLFDRKLERCTKVVLVP
ncbi:MAG: alcohol dehydrogenase family protein [Planctomycetota bacterium]